MHVIFFLFSTILSMSEYKKIAEIIKILLK